MQIAREMSSKPILQGEAGHKDGDGDAAAEKSAVQRMIERFDSVRGRFFYSRRMGTVEPVFANVRHTLGLDRFTLRGRDKGDTLK